MKKRILILLFWATNCAFTIAQNSFDSTAYTRFYNRLYPTFRIDSTLHREELTQEEKVEGLSKVWSEGTFNFANFDLVPHLNWDSAYRQFIPKCLATKGILEYYNVLKQFNQLLHDGHSRVVEPPYFFSKNNNYLPFVSQLIDGRVVLTEVLDQDTLYTKAKVGWMIDKIDDVPVRDYIQNTISPFLAYSTPQDSIARIYRYELWRGPANSPVRITFRDEANSTIVQSFERKVRDQEEVPLSFRRLSNNIGYLKLNSFNTPAVVTLFDSVFSTISSTDALIIDIRANGGGSSQYGYEIAGRLTDKPFYTSWAITKSYRPSNRAWGGDAVKIDIARWDWKPYKPAPYTKPVVLLVGPSTYSAAEDFTAVFKNMQRGLIMGSATGGSTGQPLGYDLPGGGLGFVCTKRDVEPGGEEFVGRGIVPSRIVAPTLEGIWNGRDEVLEAAQDWLRRNP
jgi:carboxyl-terminal processing protease